MTWYYTNTGEFLALRNLQCNLKQNYTLKSVCLEGCNFAKDYIVTADSRKEDEERGDAKVARNKCEQVI